MAQGRIGLLLVNGSVHIELDPIRAVHKLEAQVCRHQLGGVILAPADQLILADLLGIDALFQLQKLRLQIHIQPQLVLDIQIPGGDHVKYPAAVHTVLDVGIAKVQQVCDLVIPGKPLTCGGHHHDLALGVRHQNVPYLPVLTGIRHGGAAEFYYFHSLFPSLIAQLIIPEPTRQRRRDGLSAMRAYPPR